MLTKKQRNREIREDKIIKIVALSAVFFSLGATTAIVRSVYKSEPRPRIWIQSARPVVKDIQFDYMETLDIPKAVKAISAEFNVPYSLVMSVIQRESSFNPNAKNEDCYGLMQIHTVNFPQMHSDLAKYGVSDVQNNPIDNIFAGCYMLSLLQQKYHNWHRTLMAYNAGERKAREQWNKKIYSTPYSRAILADRKKYEDNAN